MPRYVADYLSINGTALAGTSQVATSPGIQVLQPGTDGQIDAATAVVPTVSPTISFRTHDIATSSALCLLSPLALSSTGLLAYLRLITSGTATRTTAGVKASAATGILVPRAISASIGQLAEASYDVIPYVSTGAAVLTLATTTDSLLTASAASCFTVGKAWIDSTAITGIQSITVDPGLQVEIIRGDGFSYAVDAVVPIRRPSITIETLTSTAASTLTAGPNNLTSFKVFFAAMAAGGVRVADATTSHLKFSGTSAVARVETLNGDNGLTRIVIEPYSDLTNAVIVRTNGVAIA